MVQLDKKELDRLVLTVERTERESKLNPEGYALYRKICGLVRYFDVEFNGR